MPKEGATKSEAPPVEQAEIGLIGLGVMGANLSLNIAEKGKMRAA